MSFRYTVYIRPWKKKGRFEIIKYPKGLRNLWERISIEQYKNEVPAEKRVRGLK